MQLPTNILCPVACCAVAASAYCRQPVPVTPEQANVLQLRLDQVGGYEELFWNTDSIPDRAAIARQAELLAYSSLDSRSFGYGYECRAAASLLKHSNEQARAERLLLAVADAPETPHDCVSALRQLGQMQQAQQRWVDAFETFDRAVVFALQSPEGAIHRDSGSFGVCAIELGRTAPRVHRSDRAEFAYRSLINYSGAYIEQSQIISAYHGLIQLYRDREQDGHRMAVYEDLFRRFPRFGLEGDEGVGTRIAYYKLKHPDHTSDEYLNSLLDIWIGNTLTSPNTLYALGDTLANVYKARGDRADTHNIVSETCTRLRELDPASPEAELIRDKQLYFLLLRLIDTSMAVVGDPVQAEAALMEADSLCLRLNGHRIPSFDGYTRAIDRIR